MEDKYLAYLFIAILLIIPILAFIFTRFNAENIILKYLHERGAKNIRVYYEWFEFDRDTMTFSVEYTHPNGNQVSSRCKLRRWSIFLSGEIFWSSSLNLESPKIEENPFEIALSEYDKLSARIRSRTDRELPTYDISSVLSIPHSDDKIVMMKYLVSFKNIFRCKSDGSIMWQAELPTVSGDVYTNIEWKDQQLTAFSRSCILVTLDVETGKILSPKVGA